jgi:hypothetical protein
MERAKRNPFPYDLVAKLWADGKTIAEIAERVGRIDWNREDGDKYHTMRVFLMRTKVLIGTVGGLSRTF